MKAYLKQQQNSTGDNGNGDNNGGNTGTEEPDDNESKEGEDDGGSSRSNGSDKKSQSNVKILGNIQLETVYLGTSSNIIVNLKFVMSLMHKVREIFGHLIPSPEIIHSAIWVGPKLFFYSMFHMNKNDDIYILL